MALGKLGLGHVEYLIEAYIRSASCQVVHEDVVNFIEANHVDLLSDERELKELFLNPGKVKEFLSDVRTPPLFSLQDGRKMNSAQVLNYFEELILTNKEILIKAVS